MRLTPTSYIVLGLVESAGEATPYELKTMVSQSVGHFWTLQHAQLYTEPERLTAAGLLVEHREAGGRRRKHYTITKAGRAALKAWREEPATAVTELRDPGMLKLFFGADPARLAPAQVDAHSRKLAEFESLLENLCETDGPIAARRVLEAGIGHEKEWVRFWSALADADAATDPDG